VSHDSKIIQHGKWDEGVILDSNTIRRDVWLFYNPLESPSGMARSENGWEIKGIVTIDTIYGTFKKPFESNILKIYSEMKWETLVREIKDATT
jgi:hypothetical protein